MSNISSKPESAAKPDSQSGASSFIITSSATGSVYSFFIFVTD